MMARESELVIRLKLSFTNERCIEKLQVLIQHLEEAGADLPWNEDIKEAIGAARYLSSHVSFVDGTKRDA